MVEVIMTELMVSLNCSGNTDSSCVFIVVTENVGAIVKKKMAIVMANAIV